MTSPPPRSTLFPYTTLFRSFFAPRHAGLSGKRSILDVHVADVAAERLHGLDRIASAVEDHVGRIEVDVHVAERSEEHTSELQSRVDLVCRLLLEKKKKKINYKNEECILDNTNGSKTSFDAMDLQIDHDSY